MLPMDDLKIFYALILTFFFLIVLPKINFNSITEIPPPKGVLGVVGVVGFDGVTRL